MDKNSDSAPSWGPFSTEWMIFDTGPRKIETSDTYFKVNHVHFHMVLRPGKALIWPLEMHGDFRNTRPPRPHLPAVSPPQPHFHFWPKSGGVLRFWHILEGVLGGPGISLFLGLQRGYLESAAVPPNLSPRYRPQNTEIPGPPKTPSSMGQNLKTPPGNENVLPCVAAPLAVLTE